MKKSVIEHQSDGKLPFDSRAVHEGKTLPEGVDEAALETASGGFWGWLQHFLVVLLV